METVTNRAAPTLEGVVESGPVSDLVSQRASLVERSIGTSREGSVEENNAVKIGVCLVLVREGSVTEDTVSVSNYVSNSVDIECEGVSHSKRGLHSGLLGGIRSDIEPLLAFGPGDFQQLENSARVVIVVVQDRELFVDLGISTMEGLSEKKR